MSRKWWVGVIVLAVIVLIVVVMAGTPFGARLAGMRGKTPRRESFHGEIGRGEWPMLWGLADNASQCADKEVKFTAFPIAVEEIEYIEPMGELREGHIMPGDHMGIDYVTSPASKPVKVYAPADGFIVRVEKHAYTPPAGYPNNLANYHVYMEHSCTMFTGLVHVTGFDEEILQNDGAFKQFVNKKIRQFDNMAMRIPVEAGQEIGTAWSFGLLGMVTVDLEVTNGGYLNPESYRSENWRINSVAPFDYVAEPLRSRLLSKNPRTAEPRGGKIDFDQKGKMAGNWFLKGSGGFRDETVAPRQCGNFPCPYWEGHLALVYDYVDPGQLRVSVGYDVGLSGRTPFGVKGNGPDFASVGMKNGLIKYELVGLKDVSRERGYEAESPLMTVNDESVVLGAMLVQMVDEETMKMEIFVGRTKEQVNGFTNKAREYIR